MIGPQQHRVDHRSPAGETNLREIKEVQGRNWPDRALIVSLMVPTAIENSLARKSRQTRSTDTWRSTRFELNFGCPHGMSGARDGRGRRSRCPSTGRAWSRAGAKAKHAKDAGLREAHTQHHRRALSGARAKSRGGADADFADQHHQFASPASTSTSWNPQPARRRERDARRLSAARP